MDWKFSFLYPYMCIYSYSIFFLPCYNGETILPLPKFIFSSILEFSHIIFIRFQDLSCPFLSFSSFVPTSLAFKYLKLSLLKNESHSTPHLLFLLSFIAKYLERATCLANFISLYFTCSSTDSNLTFASLLFS